MLKYLKLRFPLLLLLFPAVTFLLESCISENADLKTTPVDNKSLFFEWFYDYKNAASFLDDTKSDDPAVSFMKSEYYFLKGDDSEAFSALKGVFENGNRTYMKAAVNLIHSMYLTFDNMNFLVDMENVNPNLDAQIAFNIERLYWAVDMGDDDKAVEIAENIPF